MNDYDFTEEDKKLIVLMDAYDKARADLLAKETNLHALWRVISAADAMREQLGMMP